MIIRELKELLDEFLNRWTIDDIRKMTLQEYVGIGNKDTFCVPRLYQAFVDFAYLFTLNFVQIYKDFQYKSTFL